MKNKAASFTEYEHVSINEFVTQGSSEMSHMSSSSRCCNWKILLLLKQEAHKDLDGSYFWIKSVYKL